MGRASKCDREKGQGAIEYAAVIIAVSALVLALILLATPLGKRIGCEIQSAIDRMLGGPGLSCGDIVAEEDTHKPTEPCVLSETEREKTVSGTVIITVKGGGRIKVEEMSDGTYRVTQTGILSVGYELHSGGISLSGTQDDRTVDLSKGGGPGGGAEFGAEVNASGEASSTYIVDSEEAKDELVAYLQNQVDTGVATAVSPLWGATKHVWDYMWDNDGARSYTPPEPAERNYQIGTDGEVRGSASKGASGIEGSAGAASALGVTAHNDGTTTFYYAASANADVSGNISFSLPSDDWTASTDVANATAEGQLDNVIAVTVDKSGKPVSMSMTSSMSGSVDAGVYNVFGDGGPSWNKGGGRVYENTIDMTDPRSAEVGYDLMLAAGIPVYGATRTIQGENPFENYVREAKNNGVSTRRDVTSKDSTTNLAIKAVGKFDGINIGGGYKDESATIEYGNGEYWNGNEWVDWGGC
ncbi:hypothetical protein [Actinomyces qiguomingii]|uniref:hypothetical protein n=1 Tax=Actinomyces qiguomingii TaxID=2057800 RepID=UPI000FFEF6E0|nr:hypothetical protein [Actinomyces qiguomingii]